MTRASAQGRLPFRLITAFVLTTFVLSTATIAYSVPQPAYPSKPPSDTTSATQQAPVATAQIRGVKYNDKDFDGMREPGEEGLAGWTMILTSASRPGWQATATTGADGTFAFTGLVAATYAVTEVEKAGWHNTNGLPHYVTVLEGQIADTDNEIGSVEDRVELTLTRSASPMTYVSAGDVITFTYTVRNTGNVGFHAPFSITDDKVPVTFPNIQTLPACAETSFTAKYTVTQADVDAGMITSTAVARVADFAHSSAATITVRLNVVAADTDLLISASHYGRRRHQKVTIYSRLKAGAGAQYLGCEVLFQVKRPGSTSWTTVAQRTVDPLTGKARYVTALNFRGTYQWRTRFLGTDHFESTASRTVRIKVTR